ncbi:hypothetical protein [Massilia scottii]|uniref:hypothetical protein n=1 Tax=Massilia scottii TaxID=3057166 RepID=UPI002796D74B|nr:hypothetical protein [Massilia sp. CCM 9029]MDQ1829400.1 hypothetical protein [Massilia sp. CCM 9029]
MKRTSSKLYAYLDDVMQESFDAVCRDRDPRMTLDRALAHLIEDDAAGARQAAWITQAIRMSMQTQSAASMGQALP